MYKLRLHIQSLIIIIIIKTDLAICVINDKLQCFAHQTLLIFASRHPHRESKATLVVLPRVEQKPSEYSCPPIDLTGRHFTLVGLESGRTKAGLYMTLTDHYIRAKVQFAWMKCQ